MAMLLAHDAIKVGPDARCPAGGNGVARGAFLEDFCALGRVTRRKIDWLGCGRAAGATLRRRISNLKAALFNLFMLEIFA